MVYTPEGRPEPAGGAGMGWKAIAWAHGPIVAGAQVEAQNTYLRAPAVNLTAPSLDSCSLLMPALGIR